MNLYLRKRRNFSQRYVQSSLLSPNGQIIIFQTLVRNITLFSALLQKQIRKLEMHSFAYSFSPSSNQFAFSPSMSALQVVRIATNQQVKIKLNSQRAFIIQIQFMNENMLIAVSFITSEIFIVDIRIKTTIQIIQMNVLCDCLDYGYKDDIIVLIESQTYYLQVWNTSDGSKLFQSDLFTYPISATSIQLIDSKNLVLVKFYDSQILYQINYLHKKIYPYQFQIPVSIYGYAKSQIHDNQIVTIVRQMENQAIIILINQLDCPNTSIISAEISSIECGIQLFRSKNDFILTILSSFDEGLYGFYEIQFIKINQK